MSISSSAFWLSRLAIATLALVAAGCATPPTDDPEALVEYEQRNDPLEPTNRAIFAFNDGVDYWLLEPVARAYHTLMPEFGRGRVRDVLTNLAAPVVLVNDVLQGEGERAWTTLRRFALNSSFGVLGIMDVAAEMGLPAHDEDFGQTLAVWGMGPGPYVVVPLYGPSTPRDFGGKAVDWLYDPFSSTPRTAVAVVDKREYYLDLIENVRESSLDFYSAMRSSYRQRREEQINNGRSGGGAMTGPLTGELPAD